MPELTGATRQALVAHPATVHATVEVTDGLHHGGPWPASSDPRATSAHERSVVSGQ